jgi:hypothetical protein
MKTLSAKRKLILLGGGLLALAGAVLFQMRQESRNPQAQSASVKPDVSGAANASPAGSKQETRDFAANPGSGDPTGNGYSSTAKAEKAARESGRLNLSNGPVQPNRDGLTDPLPEPSVSPGERVSAVATVGGQRTPELHPGPWGAFPRVYIPEGGKAKVQLNFPDASPGEQVVVAVNDGGHLADGKPAQAFQLDASKQISVDFEANREQGYYRLSVRHLGQTKTVQFWAGNRALAVNR